jgi:hypothetical protein
MAQAKRILTVEYVVSYAGAVSPQPLRADCWISVVHPEDDKRESR